MRIKTQLYIFFMMAVALAQSCQKEKEPVPERPIPEYKLPDDFLRYFAFKPGSYWVYKNTKNGDIDTVTVTDYNFGYHTLINGGNGRAMYKFESFDGAMHSKYYDATWSYNTDFSPGTVDKNDIWANYFLILGTYSPSWGGCGETPILYYNFNSKDNIKFVSKLINYDTSIQIGSITYDSVNVFKMRSSMFYDSDVIIYFKKNLGMLRKNNLINGDDWVVIDYKANY